MGLLKRHWGTIFKQNSRIDWLSVGDQSTAYFQQVADSIKSYNSIISLCLQNGQIITDPDEMSDLAVSHFQQILAPSSLPPTLSTLIWFHDLDSFRCSPHHIYVLSSIPSSEEITQVLMKLNPNKSPSPDGFSSAFFKSAWSLVGDEFITTIQRLFTTWFLPASKNATILILVPKNPGASSISDYRAYFMLQHYLQKNFKAPGQETKGHSLWVHPP